jgi:hypothetical protein
MMMVANRRQSHTFTERKWVSIESGWTLAFITARKVSAYSIQSTGRFVSEL